VSFELHRKSYKRKEPDNFISDEYTECIEYDERELQPITQTAETKTHFLYTTYVCVSVWKAYV